MVQIEKGEPRRSEGPPRTELGELIRELAEAAYADKGEWYSVEQPPGISTTSIHGAINGIVSRVVSERSTKDNRVWIRFHKDA